MGVKPLPGDEFGDFKIELTNLEREENRENAKRQKQAFQKFPMMIHKPAGLIKRVENEDELQAAIAKGWHENIRTVPQPEQADPDGIHLMTVAQAAALIEGADVSQLAQLEADERAHGSRVAVLAIIEDRKDAVDGGTPIPLPPEPPKRGRPKKAA